MKQGGVLVRSLRRVLQAGDYADDPVMEAYLQLLAADKSKVSFC